MSRLVHRPIEIQNWEDGEPNRFQDGGVVHTVKIVIDRWLEMGDWWNGEGERELWRVITDRNEWFDIERMDGQWYIYRVWD